MNLRAQTFTFEAMMSLVILTLVILLIVFAVPLTPLTSSAANIQVENALEKYGVDVINAITYESLAERYSPLKEALLFWDGETMYGGVESYPGSERLKAILNQTFEKEGIAYNIEIGYFKFDAANGTIDFVTIPFVWNGYPSDNAVTVSKVLTIYDSDGSNQGIKALTFNVDGNTSELYNVLEVRLTIWKM
ncbi:hypothetical protein Ferp_0925 [Ferroglobus placidus DSM 10642]|uniref:Uncharacterized protein n=1 Tax=Ferroglobus placidus (strain DSM 10642 / AEDII12DO) TaxID=589924 RepID=D3RX78_FERPA|nr:hypothetical protein [Ferroglobus placidus]ADC65091.1 hypothetical protein Ferp_0925 [Ferroglobus placidus DSM 10642]